MTQAAMDKDTMVAVTPEDRGLFKALFIANPDDSLCSDTIDRGLWDDDWRMKQIALTRHHSEGRTGAGEALADIDQAIYELHEGLTSDLPNSEAGWINRRRFENAEARIKAARESIIAALSQSTAGEDGA